MSSGGGGVTGDPAAMIGLGADYYLQAGLLHAGPVMTITTILGSCIAVCLWDSVQRSGGMNHFMLPRGPAARGAETRFGEHAIPRLLDAVFAAGAVPGRLQAKVFGGASVHAAAQQADHLGLKNAEIAFQLLAAAKIPVVARDVGGTRGRKLVFHTGDGSAFVKYL